MANAQGAGSGPGNSRLLNTNLFKKPVVTKAPVVAKPKTVSKPAVHTRNDLEKEKLSVKTVKKSPIAKKAPIVQPAVHTRADLEKEKLAMKATAAKKTPAVHTRAELEKEKLALKNAPKPVVSKTTTIPKASAPRTTSIPKVTAPTNTAKPGAVTNPKTTAPSTTAPQVNNDRLNALWAEATGYKNQIADLLKNGFQYNPESDASYQSLKGLADKNAKAASGVAMEEMNDRGILNSTITSDRMGHIQQSAQDQVTAAVPQLQAAAYAKYSDKLSTLYNMMNTTLDSAENERNFGEGQRQFDTSMGENMRQYDLSRADQNSQWSQGFSLDQDKFNFDKEQTKIENGLRQQGLDLESSRFGLDELRSIQEQGAFTDQKSTQAALSEMLQFTDPTEAYEYLSQNSYKYYQGGVNLDEIINALDKRFKGFKAATTGENVTFK